MGSPRAGGEVDVCCRDPNYKDPWPEQEQARKESRALDEGDQWRWSKDARNGVNAARARSKVASNSQKGRVVASNPQQPRVVASNPQPGRVVASEPLQPRVVASEPQQPRVVASNPQQPRVVENQAPASFPTSQLPTRVDGNQPASILKR